MRQYTELPKSSSDWAVSLEEDPLGAEQYKQRKQAEQEEQRRRAEQFEANGNASASSS